MAEDIKHKYIKIPNTEVELDLKLNKIVVENGNINKKLEEHPGIISAYNAFNINRSPNTCYMYLLGVTGSGKSSTVNFLFDKEISPTGSEESITLDTCEHISLIKDSRIFIKNLSISVIDGPGLEDTHGIEEEAKNILCHKQFIETHLQLAKIKPNVVMIALPVTDHRIGNEKSTNTPFARMLKTVKEFLGPKLIDYEHPNVIFVLTQFNSLNDKQVKDLLPKRIKMIKVLSAKCLGVTDPPVMVSENYPQDCNDLKKDSNDWYILRNGDKHPLYLFDKIFNLCKKSNDFVGQEAISMYFSQKIKDSDIQRGHHLSHNEVKVDEGYQQILNRLRNIKMDTKETEISKLLEKKFEEVPNEIKMHLDPLTPTNVASFLEKNNVTSLNQLPQGHRFLELFSKYPHDSYELLQFLQNSLSIRLQKAKIDTKIGYCYNVMTDNILGTFVYKLNGNTKMTWFGFEIPDEFNIFEENSTFSRAEQFSNLEEYMRKRLSDLSVNADITNFNSNISIRNGYSVSRDSSKKFSEKTILIERHCFRLTIDEDKLQLSDRFKEDVNELPEFYDKNDVANINRWKDFYLKYGTHVTKTAWGGGAFVATVKMASSDASEESLHELMVQIQVRLLCTDLNIAYNNNMKSKNEKLFQTLSIQMEGGDPSFHVTNLQALTSEISNGWLSSIEQKPSILSTKLELIPISLIVGSHRPEIRDTFSIVCNDLFGANLKYTPLRGRTNDQEIKNAKSRQDAKNKYFPVMLPLSLYLFPLQVIRLQISSKLDYFIEKLMPLKPSKPSKPSNEEISE